MAINLYKKNPKISGNVCVQKQLFDDDTVVYGEEFRSWADSKTLSGKPQRLVRVEREDLTEAQEAFLIKYAETKPTPPPRHLGVIKSNFIRDKVTDGIVISTGTKDVEKPAAVEEESSVELTEPPEPQEPVETEPEPDVSSESEEVLSEAPRTVEDIVDEQPEPIVLSEGEMIDLLPGVTEKNIKKVVKKIGNTPDAIINASNAELTKAGVKSSFHKRLRGAASEIEVEEE